jgi:hypothetical protein
MDGILNIGAAKRAKSVNLGVKPITPFIQPVTIRPQAMQYLNYEIVFV